MKNAILNIREKVRDFLGFDELDRYGCNNSIDFQEVLVVGVLTILSPIWLPVWIVGRITILLLGL